MAHMSKRVTHGDLSVDIDERIAGVVEALWKNGITTEWSCENKDGRCWVQMGFPSLCRLLELLGESRDLITPEYGGPAGSIETRSHNVFFSIEDVPRIERALASEGDA